MTGTLYLVATPIGNLEDMTFRAVRVLKEADLIACEDTRTSQTLLRHFEITTPLTSYHKYNEKEKSARLIERLTAGESIALISDAGMPLISDPGSVLVRECREAGIPVTVVPGANAALSALVLSGEDSRRFVFEGFLPQDNKEKAAVLDRLKNETSTVILYEAPHRLKKTLKSLYEALGEPSGKKTSGEPAEETASGGSRHVTICRELTKKFETVETMTLREAAVRYENEEPRGEYVLILQGRDKEELAQEAAEAWQEMSVSEHVAYYEAKGMDRKAAMKAAAADRGVSKRDIYAELL